MTSPTVIYGQLLLPAPGDAVRLAPGGLVIRGDTIERVAVGEDARQALGTPDLGGDEFLVSPAFVDTHLHLPQFDSIGIDGLELLDWLDRVIFPAEAKWADAAYARAMARRVGEQLLSFGTTSIAAYATVHHAGAQGAIDELGAMGFSGCVGQVLMDRNAPAELVRPARQLVEEALRLAPRGRVHPSVTPRFAITCSPELLQGAGQIAASTNWIVQTHLAETRREIDEVSRLFGGSRYLDVYANAGLIRARTLLAHGIHLDERDHALIRDQHATIAHCPTANRFLEAGTMDRHAARSRGVRVSLGSDVAGGNERSMVRVARAMNEAAKARRMREAETAAAGVSTPLSTAAHAWWQITRGNAEALGLTDLGELRPGARADVILARPTPPWQTSADPLSMLLHAWDDRWIERVWVGGQVGYSPG